MTSIRQRLEKIEAAIKPSVRRTFFVLADEHHTDTDIAKCLASHGYSLLDNDLLIMWRSIGPGEVMTEPELMSATVH
ncbi:hypothetical protein PY650_24410 [Rhizobium calliandrae]|uniref:Uncharacterized protein n=1 Tax=Rhizobium calliandrae TaxID=1312182 RepID=A0ABT7KJI3_9HYPH|nr:hypothetical protein [Rhizobium calliandrae]MDL2408727.1 hypothetical protein [Rhizobium calliandrae]